MHFHRIEHPAIYSNHSEDSGDWVFANFCQSIGTPDVLHKNSKEVNITAEFVRIRVTNPWPTEHTTASKFFQMAACSCTLLIHFATKCIKTEWWKSLSTMWQCFTKVALITSIQWDCWFLLTSEHNQRYVIRCSLIITIYLFLSLRGNAARQSLTELHRINTNSEIHAYNDDLAERLSITEMDRMYLCFSFFSSFFYGAICKFVNVVELDLKTKTNNEHKNWCRIKGTDLLWLVRDESCK